MPGDKILPENRGENIVKRPFLGIKSDLEFCFSSSEFAQIHVALNHKRFADLNVPYVVLAAKNG